MRTPLTLLLSGLLLCAGGCEDKNTPTPDTGADQAVADQGADAPGETGPDQAAPDLAALDGPAAEAAAAKDLAGKEAAPSDMKSKDITPDVTKDAGPPAVWGYISRSVIPVNNGKGNVIISMNEDSWPIPLPVTSIVVKGVDLSKAGAKVKYQLNASVTSGKTYLISAWMNDNNNAYSPLAIAMEGDLGMKAIKKVKLSAGLSQVDLVLDKLITLGAVDGGVSGGMLKGRVTSTAAPSGDGVGPLIVSLFKSKPPTGLLTVTSVPAANLSSQFLSEAFYFNGIKAGNYYLQVSLDDNANAAGLLGLNANPDKGDMIHSKAIQVHLVGGKLQVQDVVLDALKQ